LVDSAVSDSCFSSESCLESAGITNACERRRTTSKRVKALIALEEEGEVMLLAVRSVPSWNLKNEVMLNGVQIESYIGDGKQLSSNAFTAERQSSSGIAITTWLTSVTQIFYGD
jgi:hypothetical protein